jgi:phosphonate degradation associated HDIG domain protein
VQSLLLRVGRQVKAQDGHVTNLASNTPATPVMHGQRAHSRKTPMTDPRYDTIAALISRFGQMHYGEAITQIDHGRQCGQLAIEAGEEDAMVVAALLHDIGQFTDGAGNAAETMAPDARHEDLGADFLSRWFGPEVTEPVRLHVAAKRYLCAVQPGYAQGLSGASKLSLALQGGPMSRDEAATFEAHPWHASAVRLRGYDDGGKRIGWQVPELVDHHDRIVALMV